METLSSSFGELEPPAITDFHWFTTNVISLESVRSTTGESEGGKFLKVLKAELSLHLVTLVVIIIIGEGCSRSSNGGGRRRTQNRLKCLCSSF